MVGGSAAVLARLSPAGWAPARVYSRSVDLEEHTVEDVGERCEECGAKLTSAEFKAVLESGGPTLCAIHAGEVVPIEDDAAQFPE